MRFKSLFIFFLFSSDFAVLAQKQSLPADVAPSQELIEQLEKKKRRLEQDELKQRKALDVLQRLNLKIKKIVKNKSKIQNSIDELQVHLDETNRHITELEAVILKQKSLLAERLRAISKMGASQVMGFLLSSSNAADLERNLKILGLIVQKDQKMIKEFQTNNHELALEKNKLTERMNVLQSKNLELSQQEYMFTHEQDLKKDLVDTLRKNRLFKLKQISELRKKTQGMDLEDNGILDGFLRPSFYEQKGRLLAPVEGKVTRQYGLERDLIHPIQIQHRGVHITAPEGSPVKSVFEGEITYVGILPGFGPTVIVDHGDHFYTVYGNNKKIDVNEGQKIQKHQVIAQSGMNIHMNEPGIYFEVRHFSEPDDPQKWMKGQ